MFDLGWVNDSSQVKKRIIGLICLLLGMSIGYQALNKVQGKETIAPLIRFHVIANSDSEEDQLLKYAVRDEILKKVAPRLAESVSLEESRGIIQEMEGEFLAIAETVMKERGKDYPLTLDYGLHTFPTKSYGNIVLPGGEYEAVKIMIGKAQGANWWCVLFPPLCFVNVEESTSLPVDGKPGVPLDTVQGEKANSQENEDSSQGTDSREKDDNSLAKGDNPLINKKEKLKVKFFFSRFFK
mgnify:CR=1 FL=1|jgi:stage II sporulation protein R